MSVSGSLFPIFFALPCAESYGSSVFQSQFLRNCQIIIHSGWIILYSLQQHTWLLISLHPLQHLLFSSKKKKLQPPIWSSISLWFWFTFPSWLMILSIFLCAYSPFVSLLWKKCVFRFFDNFKNWVVFVVEL